MNKDIKSMCLELARLALETKDIHVHITSHTILITHYEFKGRRSLYYENIHFPSNNNTVERLKKAIEYVKSLGGNE